MHVLFTMRDISLMPLALTSVCLGVFSGPVQRLCFHWSVYVSHTDADGVLLEFVCVAETEGRGTDHLGSGRAASEVC